MNYELVYIPNEIPNPFAVFTKSWSNVTKFIFATASSNGTEMIFG